MHKTVLHQQGDSQRSISQKLVISQHGMQFVFKEGKRKRVRPKKLSTTNELEVRDLRNRRKIQQRPDIGSLVDSSTVTTTVSGCREAILKKGNIQCSIISNGPASLEPRAKHYLGSVEQKVANIQRKALQYP